MKKTRNLLIIGSILLVIMVIGITYALLTVNISASKVNVIKIGDLDLVLDESASSGITLTDEVAVPSDEGLAKDPFSFSLINNGNLDLYYVIYLDDDSLLTDEVRIDDKYIKYSLDKDNVVGAATDLTSIREEDTRLLARKNGIIQSKQTIAYKLRLWLNAEVDGNYSGQVFRAKLRVEARQKSSDVMVAGLPSNPKEITDYMWGDPTIMYAFNHEATDQTEALTVIDVNLYNLVFLELPH